MLVVSLEVSGDEGVCCGIEVHQDQVRGDLDSPAGARCNVPDHAEVAGGVGVGCACLDEDDVVAAGDVNPPVAGG